MKSLKGALLGGAMMLAAGGTAIANDEKPKYGGSVEIGTVYVTLSALSWDANDFNWKHNHDTGLVYEQLFAADLSKSVKAGGKHPFIADAWLPSDAMRGATSRLTLASPTISAAMSPAITVSFAWFTSGG